MISVKNVAKSFGSNQVLKDITFQVQNGERVSLIGPGGSGKTTILKMLLGLIEADSGEALINGSDLSKVPKKEALELLKKVGMAFQQGGLFDFMTVKENLIFAMEHMGEYSREDMDKKIKYLLNAVKLGRTEDMFPYELSGGMKRRVGITRALCTDPDVAIFDEPTSGLDPVTSTIIMNMIKDLGGENPNAALLVATTNVEIAIRFASRVILVNEGKVVADGSWREILLEGDEWVKHFLGVRLIGLDLDYAKELDLPPAFIKKYWLHADKYF